MDRFTALKETHAEVLAAGGGGGAQHHRLPLPEDLRAEPLPGAGARGDLVQEPQHPHRRVDGQELQPARPPQVPVRMVRTTLFKDLLNKCFCFASIQTIKHLQYLLSKLKVESCKE